MIIKVENPLDISETKNSTNNSITIAQNNIHDPDEDPMDPNLEQPSIIFDTKKIVTRLLNR